MECSPGRKVAKTVSGYMDLMVPHFTQKELQTEMWPYLLFFCILVGLYKSVSEAKVLTVFF
ncbi:Hypothetical protein FKW44_001593 [Caligus rogercresseyi]|uniref:Uncharacterized protein n=1 Tax=Caligus rogercresseyi TaxID=217165 RepID=A0A7T8KIY7_CALRO|nr:Hypothetical protein FKW44_001593 [Caligus rogercresseyi]